MAWEDYDTFDTFYYGKAKDLNHVLTMEDYDTFD